MNDESLMIAARAAGFAFAAEEADVPLQAIEPTPTPHEVLAPILTREIARPAPYTTVLQRAYAAAHLPNWVAGRA
jgi:hypothetical protein